MGSPRTPRYSPPAPGISTGDAEARQKIAQAATTARAQRNSSVQNATQAVVAANKAIGAQLPPGADQPGQSAANVAAIARASQANANGNHMASPGHMPGSTSSTPPSVGPLPFRGSTPAEVADFNKGADLPPQAPGTADAIAANANTGKDIATPYGTVKSGAPSAQGPNLAGPAGAANWQQQVVNAHPNIGVKDSPENKAFVAAIRDKYPKGIPDNISDHMDIADAAVGNANRLPGSPLSMQSGVPQTADATPQTITPNPAAEAARSRSQALQADAQSSAPVSTGTPSTAPIAPSTGIGSSSQFYQPRLTADKPLTPPPIPAAAQVANSTPASRGVSGDPSAPSATPTVDRVAAQQAAPVDLKSAKAYADVFHSSVGPLFGAGTSQPSIGPQPFTLAPAGTPANSGAGSVPSYQPDQTPNTASF